MPKKKPQPTPEPLPENELDLSPTPQGVETFHKPVLVCLKDWFHGPDGDQYRCIWGPARFITGEDMDPKLPDANKLFLAVGSGDREAMVDWSNVASVITCPTPPHRTPILIAMNPEEFFADD